MSAALVIGLCAGPVPSVAAQPTLDERLERLAEEIERNRVELHAPGAALVVVQGDEVVFARGFGLADLENETPVTPDTRFFIGSSTKAFTATLLGMLVDEGVMDWDDPVEQHLPYFTLPVESDRDARAAIRDLLSHRTGFARMNMLWVSGALTPEEILRQAVQAEPFASFRERWYYNNVMYLAAGWAGAAAAGAPWDELVTERILVPLGMTDTQTSIRDARGGPLMARGYTWNEDLEEFRLHVPSGDSVGVDPIAPAGSISSSVLDMAKWLRFLLANGVVDGQRLISEEALTETWTRQIRIGGGVGYGLGWMLRDWQGQRVIEHGGNVPGFSAQVAILPESDLGFVLLTNASASMLAPLAITVVPSTLLGEWTDADPAGEIDDFRPYLGRYVANFATFSNEIFTVLERNGHLALDIPSQRVYDLNPPDDEGRWQFTLTDQISVSFERDDAGAVVALTMRQSGMVFEVLREGIEVKPEIDLDELQKYPRSVSGRARGLLHHSRHREPAARVPGTWWSRDLRPQSAGRQRSLGGSRERRADDRVRRSRHRGGRRVGVQAPWATGPQPPGRRRERHAAAQRRRAPRAARDDRCRGRVIVGRGGRELPRVRHRPVPAGRRRGPVRDAGRW